MAVLLMNLKYIRNIFITFPHYPPDMERITIFIFFIVVMGFFSSCTDGAVGKTTHKDSLPAIDSVNAVRLELITNDVNFPVQMKYPADNSGRLFITDAHGKIFVFRDSKLLPGPFLDITAKLEKKDSAFDVNCIYSMEFSPQFAKNKKFYVCYNAPTTIDSNTSKLVISEFSVSALNPDQADPNSEKRIFELEGHSTYRDPCDMIFGPDGYLYVSIGDNGTPMKGRKGEDLNSFLGKVIRIDVSKLPYTIPGDNPFLQVKHARPEIWAYGFRRLWRFSFDSLTHELIGGDVGDKLQEEIDIVTKGGNYGWPLIEGDSIMVKKDSLKGTNFVAPVATYTHKTGICVIGGAFYYGAGLPTLYGRYIFADWNGNIFSLSRAAQGRWPLQQLRVLNKPPETLIINSCNADPGGEIYVMGILKSGTTSKGAVYKLVRPI